ncbi:MAG: DNA primase [Cellulomonadaceae bacterium TMED98]|nr:MAG: DNA primase [Cellulomonadaceae bacterium TMED98]
MAGRIRRSDIDEVRQRVNIADVIGDYVTLKSAGVGSMKGLCPFHDERSPSFHVRPQAGFYHCFGCGEGGDIYTFLQKVDALSFTESVERLAQRVGYTLHYEDGQAADDGQKRSRLLQVNKAAEDFFRQKIHQPEAQIGREFLADKGFDQLAAEQFGVGFAPDSFNALSEHLTAQGYTVPELIEAGVVSQGDRGIYDRFRGRVVWPIRDVTGQTVGFGARRLSDDDKGPKYLNTPETPVYHKSRVLYGLDIAKRAISKKRQVVIVEGYTDVMACHLAGIDTAVATCGTAFGADHIPLIRRVMGDSDVSVDQTRGEVIFTFDPDEAGQRAASKAFAEHAKFTAQTYVAVPPEGLDPCDVRIQRGDEALQAVITERRPMYEFMIKRVIDGADLATVEGRAWALRQAIQVVRTIRDSVVRQGYARELAGWLGMDPADVQREMAKAPSQTAPAPEVASSESEDQPVYQLSSLSQDPVTSIERDALMALLQHPDVIPLERATSVLQAHISHGALALVRDAILSVFDHYGDSQWVSLVQAEVPETLQVFVQQMAVHPLPERDGHAGQYALGVTATLLDKDLLRRKAEMLSALQRTEAGSEDYRSLQQQLVDIESTRRALRTEDS